MEVAQVLREAAEVIRERGWTQFTGVGEDGAVCLDTALHKAMFGHGIHTYERCTAVMEALREQVGVHPVIFNDRHGRTVEEVLDALDQAASEAV